MVGVRDRWGHLLEVFLVAGRLGLTSFGGPVAHIGYFRREYVVRRSWLRDDDFADLVGLCQFLPGPASSKVGIAVGLLRGGLAGGVVAWLAFTLPSAAALIALGIVGDGDLGQSGWVRGLMVAAVAVVGQAVLGMGRSLVTDVRRAGVAVAAAATVLAWGSSLAQLVAIGASAVAGLVLLRPAALADTGREPLRFGVSRRLAVASLVLFVGLLVALPVARDRWDGSHTVAMADSYYRTGALVFGGGHVVLPLLDRQVVDPGWVSERDFLAGYGAAQAVPGPLFTFAGFLGAAQEPHPNRVLGGVIALLAIFLPGFLLTTAALPFWSRLRSRPRAIAVTAGVNAAVVGILLAALYDPVITGGVTSVPAGVIAILAFAALTVRPTPPLLVVAACGLAGWLVL